MKAKMKRILTPHIAMFSPFAKPFDKEENKDNTVAILMVAPEIIKYMQDDNTKIVAKCTPCQCCACR